MGWEELLLLMSLAEGGPEAGAFGGILGTGLGGAGFAEGLGPLGAALAGGGSEPGFAVGAPSVAGEFAVGAEGLGPVAAAPSPWKPQTFQDLMALITAGTGLLGVLRPTPRAPLPPPPPPPSPKPPMNLLTGVRGSVVPVGRRRVEQSPLQELLALLQGR